MLENDTKEGWFEVTRLGWRFLFSVTSDHSFLAGYCVVGVDSSFLAEVDGHKAIVFSMLSGHFVRGPHVCSHICDDIAKFPTAGSGAVLFSCEIDVAWPLFLLGDKLPHRVPLIFV